MLCFTRFYVNRNTFSRFYMQRIKRKPYYKTPLSVAIRYAPIDTLGYYFTTTRTRFRNS